MLVRTYWPATVIWILLSALIGAWAIRRQGTQVLKQMRRALNQNQMPTDIIMEGFMVVLAGFLLMVPGLITDLFGLSLLYKPTRRWYRDRFIQWLKRRIRVTSFTMNPAANRPDVVDATVVGRRREDGTAADQTKRHPPGPRGIAR